MHSNSLSRRDKKHDHKLHILQSVVYLSIVRREPLGKLNMFDFPDYRGLSPMASDSAVSISHKQSGTIPDRRETVSSMIADELWYIKTRFYFLMSLAEESTFSNKYVPMDDVNMEITFTLNALHFIS